MWSDRLNRRVALCGLLALAGCGFTPALAPGGAANELRGRMSLMPPTTGDDAVLRRRLAERLGDGGPYSLDWQFNVGEAPAAINTAGDVTRQTLTGQAVWTLRDPANAVVATDSVESFASYSATGSTVATRAAADDARDRLLIALADLIVADLLLLAPGLAP